MARLLLPILLLLGVVAASVLTDRPLPRADVAFINSGDVNTLDPQRMSWMQDLRVARVVFEGLVRNDVLSWSFDIRPGVAERWEVSDDGTVYRFFLRPDARWSNGSPVRAQDFVFSWRRAMLPDLASDYFKLFMSIEGAREFYDWRTEQLESFASASFSSPRDRTAAANDLWEQTEARFDETVGLRALDDTTLEVRLVRPLPYFLDLCAFGVFYPVYPPLVGQYERPDPETGRLDRQPGWTKAGTLVSNGPYMLTRWRFKRDMRFEQNPHYWDRGSQAVRTIHSPSINDPNAMVLAFQTGAVDWVSDVTPPYRGDMIAAKQRFYAEQADQIAQWRAQGLDQFEIDRRLPDDPAKFIHTVPVFGTYFYNFNCQPTLDDGRPNPFADARVRRALAMLIDKRAIADEVRRLGEPVAPTLVPPGAIAGYESPKGLPSISDATTPEERSAIIARARALLAEAGHPDPTKFPVTIEILFNKDSGHDLIAQVVAKNWQQTIGLPVRLAQKEIKVFREDLKKKRFMVGRAGWYGDYGDPTTFLAINRTGDGNNDRGYSNPAYDALLDQAAEETDPAARMALLSRAEAILVDEDVPLVPIFHYASVMMFDPARLTGVSAHPRGEQNVYMFDVLGDGVGPDVPRPMHGTRTGIAAGEGGQR